MVDYLRTLGGVAAAADLRPPRWAAGDPAAGGSCSPRACASCHGAGGRAAKGRAREPRASRRGHRHLPLRDDPARPHRDVDGGLRQPLADTTRVVRRRRSNRSSRIIRSWEGESMSRHEVNRRQFLAAATAGRVRDVRGVRHERMGARTPSPIRWRRIPIANGSRSTATSGSTTRRSRSLRAERHAQLPAQRLRAVGRGHAHRPDDALRRGDRPGRQPADAPLGSARVPEGAGADAPLLRRPPCEHTAWCAPASSDGSTKASRAATTAGRRWSTSTARATSGSA